MNVNFMYICICHGVTDNKIKHAVENGAVTMKLLAQELKVGSQCGKCCKCTKRVLNSKLMEIAEASPAVA